MDFTHDALGDGRNCQLSNVLDDINSEGLEIAVDLSSIGMGGPHAGAGDRLARQAERESLGQ